MADKKPTHTVLKTFYAAEENQGIVQKNDPFTPANESRGKALEKRKLIEPGYSGPKAAAAGHDKSTQPSKTKPAPQGSNKGHNPPPPPPPPPAE